MLPTFLENLDVGSTHVYSPQPNIFVCGGRQADALELKPASIRDAFLRGNVFPEISKARVFVVESIQKQFLREGVYRDFYDFENDMAQICDLVFLISESPGSFTELGSFTRDDEVANKLFTVIRNTHFDAENYISVGPIAYLEEKQNGSVFVISDDDYNIDERDFSKLRLDLFKQRLRDPVTARMQRAREHTKFDKARNGHLCKLLTAFVQEFGALEMQELVQVLQALEVKHPEALAPKLVFCAKTVEWLHTDRRGLRTFVLPRLPKRAAKLVFSGDALPSNPERRRLRIREHWRGSDEERYTAIVANGPKIQVGDA